MRYHRAIFVAQVMGCRLWVRLLDNDAFWLTTFTTRNPFTVKFNSVCSGGSDFFIFSPRLLWKRLRLGPCQLYESNDSAFLFPPAPCSARDASGVKVDIQLSGFPGKP